MQFSHFSHNGQILPIEQATIPLGNIAYSYGFGVYESLKVRGGILYFVDQHIDRLLQSAQIIGLEHIWTKEVLKQSLNDLLNALHLQQEKSACNIKVLLIGGKEPLLNIMALPPLFPDRKLYMRGATAISVHYERLFPNAKTLNMLASYLAYKKAQTQGCYDALLLTPQNEIFEGTRTNFFAIKEKTLFTAPSEKILEGVSRMTVIAVAKKMGLQMKEFPVALSEIGKYDGAFVTSTSSKIMPLRQIDDYHLPSIPDTLRELMKSYDNFLNSCGGVFINVL